MDPTNVANQADLVAVQDQQRVARSFVSFLGSAMGLDQQSTAYDGSAANYPGRYQAIGPTGIGIEGQPVSTAQGAGTPGMSPVLLVGLAVVALLVLPKLLRG